LIERHGDLPRLFVFWNGEIGNPAVELGHGHGVNLGDGAVQTVSQRIL